MKFLVLFVSFALISAASADVSHLAHADGSHLAHADGYSYEKPHDDEQHLSDGPSFSVESSIGLAHDEHSAAEEHLHDEHDDDHSVAKPIVESHSSPALSQSYSQVIYGKPNSDVPAPVFHPSLPASGPVYPEEHHESSADVIDSYLPPTHEHSIGSSHDHSSLLHSHPAIYSSPASIEHKLHGEHYSKSNIPSREYLAPEHHEEHHQHHEEHHQHHDEHNQYHEAHHADEHQHHHEDEHHHHQLQLHDDHHHHHQLQHHDDQHHHHHHEHHHEELHYQQPHHDEHHHEHHHIDFHTAPAPAAQHHYHHEYQHQEYSAPASQTGGYHYNLPNRRLRHRS